MQTSAQNTGTVQRLALKRGTVHRSAQNTGNSTQISTEYWEQYKDQHRILGTVQKSAKNTGNSMQISAQNTWNSTQISAQNTGNSTQNNRNSSQISTKYRGQNNWWKYLLIPKNSFHFDLMIINYRRST